MASQNAVPLLSEDWAAIEVFVHERGAPHMIDPSKLLASATRIYGDAMDRLWGAFEPCPPDRVVTLADDAEIPGTWLCRNGMEGTLIEGDVPEPKKVKPPRTHWDMLLERRSIPELEELLEERLTLLRESRGERPRKRKSA